MRIGRWTLVRDWDINVELAEETIIEAEDRNSYNDDYYNEDFVRGYLMGMKIMARTMNLPPRVYERQARS